MIESQCDPAQTKGGGSTASNDRFHVDRDILRKQVEQRLAAHIMSPREASSIMRQSRSRKLKRAQTHKFDIHEQTRQGQVSIKSHSRATSKVKEVHLGLQGGKWERLCQQLHHELQATPAPPFHDDSYEFLPTLPRLRKPSVNENIPVVPPCRFGWEEVGDRWYREANGLDEWFFKPDDGVFFHAASSMLWVELPGWGLVRSDVAQRRVGLHSAMLSLLLNGTSSALRLIFQNWRRLCFGSAEVARAYGVPPQSAESPQLRLPASSKGIRPTTGHVFPHGVERPPLEAAWIASAEHPGWFCSRISASWIFKATEKVLFHVPSGSLWEVDEARKEHYSLRRIDRNFQAALVCLAEASPDVIKHMCVALWRDVVVRIRSKDAVGHCTFMDKCIICMDYFLAASSLDFDPGGGAVRFGDCCHAVCIECLGLYALSAMEVRQWTCDGLRCPALACKAHLAGERILQIASLTSRQRESIATHLCHLLISQPVYCPNPKCDAVYESVGSVACPMATCSECKAAFCWQCRCLWHTGKTCSEYRTCPDAQDVSLLILAEIAGWKRCSHCGSMVERIDGCNHMMCAQCGHHFCYLCGGAFDRVRYVCLTQGCNIHQTFCREVALKRPQIASETAGQWHRWIWSHTETLDDNRCSYLLEWARLKRCSGVAYAAMIALARRSPYGLMPMWQRRAVWENRCPYCQQCGSSQQALAEHLGTLCPEQVLACCDRLFYDLEELNVHVRERHML